jgi:hypothetical protein
MTARLTEHQAEIERNLRAWDAKPLLKEIYAAFTRRILALIEPAIPGRVVELGSGIGNLKTFLPNALATDLFPNPWLDLVCDGYDLPFRRASLSHLVLFDVFHHLLNRLQKLDAKLSCWPRAFAGRCLIGLQPASPRGGPAARCGYGERQPIVRSADL